MSLHLDRIELNNFRNIEKCLLEFSPKINCIFGKNGNGKTNLLEAIFFSIFKKSFRKNVKKTDMIKESKDSFIIKSEFNHFNKSINHSFKISNSENLIYVNKVKKSKLTKLHSVSVNPYDSFLFHSQNSVKRDFINHMLSSIDEIYQMALRDFSKALKMRNSLFLKYLGSKDKLIDQLKGIDEIIARNGIILVQKRAKFTESLNPFINKIFKEIFNEPKELNFIYRAYEEAYFLGEEDIFNYYQSQIDKDILLKGTKRGIHLDNYELNLTGFNCSSFGSVGQQKVSYLSLLFSYVEYLEIQVKNPPILLLDDISGELDGECWKNLLKYLSNKNMQVFISTANDSFHKDLSFFEESKMFKVSNGVFTEL